MGAAETDKCVFLRDYKPFPFDFSDVSLSFELTPSLTIVHAEHKIRYIPPVVGGEGVSAPLDLDGDGGMELEALYLDGRVLVEGRDYTLGPAPHGAGRRLRVLSPPWAAASFTLGVVTRTFPEKETACEGIYTSNGCILTQCEAEGFRRITYFPDRPDAMARRWTVKLVAEKEAFPVLLSNGDRVAGGDLPGSRHYAVFVDPWPKPCYLFCIVAGKLVATEDSFRTAHGADVALRIWTEAHNAHKTAWAMSSLRQAFRWDEERWGRVYDLGQFNVVVVDDFNMGAMENKSLNVFNSRLVLATPETATDYSFESVQGIIGHEYFHNWTGNRVTLSSWFHLTLKEGLTVFRDQEFTSDLNSRSVKRIDDVRFMREHQFGEDGGAMAHPIRPPFYEVMDNFYTSTVYEKGAEVVRMYQTILGRDGFRRGLDRYFERHDGQAVSCDAFWDAMLGSHPLKDDFHLWYEQAGTPTVTASHSYDAAAGELTVELRQELPRTPADMGRDKRPMLIPVVVGLVSPSGADAEIASVRCDGGPPEALPEGSTTAVLLLRAQKNTFVLGGVRERPVPSILRDFSAPVRLDTDLTEEQTLFLLAHDSDAVNRWDAAQTLTARLILAALADPSVPPAAGAVVGALRQALADPGADKRLLGHMLDLPSVSDLCLRTPKPDPTAVHAARHSVMVALADALHPELLALYKANAPSGPYRFDAEGCGRRALRLTCLQYLSCGGGAEGRALAMEAFTGASNMTEQLGALKCVCAHAGPEREEALAAFYAQWKGEMLCVCHWIRVQSTCNVPGNAANVRALLSHEAFDVRSPNKCSALVRAFAHSPVNFHAADGSGYRLLADMSLMVDTVNPQVAAMCMGAFTSLRTYDAQRQEMMLAECRRLADGPTALSPNLSEVVNRCITGGSEDN